MPILLTIAAVLGLVVGSFLNVVIHRVPNGLSVVHPRSQCPQCGCAIRARHNVPVFGWLVLRGRCADCSARISARYPLVELATSALFVALTWQTVQAGMVAALPAYLVFGAAAIALAAIDIDVMRLPNKILYPAYLIVGALLVIATLIGNGPPTALARAAIGAAVLFGAYLVLALSYPGGMGLGDVKLAALIGAVLGFWSVSALVVGALAAFVVGGLAGVALLVSRRAGRKSALPFGPSMLSGAVLAIFAGAPIAHGYLHLVHPA